MLPSELLIHDERDESRSVAKLKAVCSKEIMGDRCLGRLSGSRCTGAHFRVECDHDPILLPAIHTCGMANVRRK
jgi:hypothetical protein